MSPSNLDFYLSHVDPSKGSLLALRDALIQNQLEETIKYGMPCFTYYGKALCYLWTDKKTNEPYVLFVDGNLMEHPILESGDRAKMKILRIDPNSDLPIELIRELIGKAVSLRK